MTSLRGRSLSVTQETEWTPTKTSGVPVKIRPAASDPASGDFYKR